jgi:hypothetical protein
MKLDSRHYCFLGLAIVVVAAMLPKARPVDRVSNETLRMFEYIDTLPQGSVLMVSFDHDASSLPEVQPLALAVLRHAFAKGHKLIGLALCAEGTGIGYRLMNKVASEYGEEYGRDYAYLGFAPQYIAAILSMGESMPRTFPQDYAGHAWSDVPVLQSIHNYGDLSGVISIADGSMVMHWVEYGHGRYGVTVSACVAAAMATTYDPYLASGQMNAMLTGLRGAAEYEQLTGRGESGSKGMLAQTAMHLYIIAVIIIGNGVYFWKRRRGRST